MQIERVQENTDNIQYDIVVGGLGPAGLDIALRAALAGKRVLALTDRDYYSREQVLRLDKDIAELLFGSSKKDRKQLQRDGLITIRKDKGMKLGEYYITIETGKLEEYLRDLHNTQGAHKKLDLTILQLPKASQGRNFEFDGDQRGIHIPQIQDVVYSGGGRWQSKDELENSLIQFKHFVAADGANHRIADQVNELLDSQQNERSKIEYEGRQIDQLHQYHSAVVFKIPQGMSKQFERALQKKNHQGATDEQLRAQNWRLASRPESRVLKAGNTLYIGTEAPKFAQNYEPESRRRLIEQWARTVLGDHLPQSLIDQLTYTTDDNLNAEQRQKKQQLRISPFNIQLDEAKQNYAPLWADLSYVFNGFTSLHQNTSYFFQVGDALRKPHYHTGSGAATGFRVNSALIDFFKSDGSVEALGRYDNRVKQIRDNNRVKVDNYLLARREREANARLQVLKNLHRVLDVYVKARAVLAFFAMLIAPISSTAQLYRTRFLEAYTFRTFFEHRLDLIKQDIVDLNFTQANERMSESHAHANVWRTHDLERASEHDGVDSVEHFTRKDRLHMKFFNRCTAHYFQFEEEGHRAGQELSV